MSKAYHKIIIGHNGALGDFCSIFPALIALARHFAPRGLCWAGSGERKLWLDPLEIASADPVAQRAIRRLYAADSWPEALEETLVVFFVLDTPPPFAQAWPHVWAIRGADASWRSPRALAREQLQTRGVAWPEGWQEQWAGFFRQRYAPATAAAEKPGEVLLFPGAGHQAKQWPLVKFFELAVWIEEQGLRPVFILGPAEQERELFPADRRQNWDVRCLRTMEQLMYALVAARAVCGNDCGPMHLASLVRTPGLVLFGPTARRQWAPPGLATLAQDVACRPCTRTTRSISCERPVCLTELPVAPVIRALADLLAGRVAQHMYNSETAWTGEQQF